MSVGIVGGGERVVEGAARELRQDFRVVDGSRTDVHQGIVNRLREPRELLLRKGN